MTDEQDKENKEEDKPEETPQGDDGGVQQEANDPIKQANAAAEELKRLNKEMADNLARAEKLKAAEILGGGSMAGTIEKTPEQKQEEEDKEIADKVVKGYFG